MGVYHIACLLTGCEATTLCNFPDFIRIYLYSSNRRERFKHKPRHHTSDVNAANGVTTRAECLFRAGGGRNGIGQGKQRELRAGFVPEMEFAGLGAADLDHG